MRGPFSRRWMPCREPTSWCSMLGFCSAVLRKPIIWFCRISVASSRFCAASPVFYIVIGEPFKQSAELTGEPIKMTG